MKGNSFAYQRRFSVAVLLPKDAVASTYLADGIVEIAAKRDCEVRFFEDARELQIELQSLASGFRSVSPIEGVIVADSTYTLPWTRNIPVINCSRQDRGSTTVALCSESIEHCLIDARDAMRASNVTILFDDATEQTDLLHVCKKHASSAIRIRSDADHLDKIVGSLAPRTLAVCADAELALRVLRAAKQAGRSVPEELGILSLTESPKLRASAPQVSSLDPGWRHIGTTAMDVLASYLLNHPREPIQKRLRPNYQKRESTLGSLNAQPLALRAQRLIEQQLPSAITINELMRALDVSSKTLNKHFAAQFGFGVSEYIRRRRFQIVSQKLCKSSDPLHQIAQSCGFCDSSQLVTFVRRESGLTPMELRSVSAIESLALVK